VVHDLNLTAKFADTVTLLHHGKVLATGSADEVLNVVNIKTAYEMEPGIIPIDGKKYLYF
jgi:iron complex transport system ATP-binding protein